MFNTLTVHKAMLKNKHNMVCVRLSTRLICLSWPISTHPHQLLFSTAHKFSLHLIHSALLPFPRVESTMATHPNFHAIPFDGSVQNTEFKFSSLYLHHISSGPSRTQSKIINADATTGWGQTAVNNWPIYDGAGTTAKVVARAQGLHINAGSWYNTFTIVFETERFKESTLQVTGASVDKGEWSIVGGTGELAMACGVVTKSLHGTTVGGDIIELTIHGFCRKQIAPTKVGPWGGNGGSVVESDKPWKIESITILYQGVIASLEYSYINQSGNKRTAGPWGSKNPNRAEIVLGPEEILTAVSGTITKHNNLDVIQTLKFVTNKKTHGPYGNTDNAKVGTPFSTVAPNGKTIVGFFGRTDMRYLNALGVYVA